MRNVKNLTLCVGILIMVPFLGFASPSGGALAAVNTMDYYDLFDLETGTVIPEDPHFPGPPSAACDFHFAYNADREPHAVIFQNQSNPFPGVEIAYSEEDYTDVTFSDVAGLVFTPLLIDIPFDKVAVLLTTEGNYFKVGLGPISENDPFSVTFEWEQLQGVEVDIDIKPGSFPNSINPNAGGVISVAILTTDIFDASTVDPQTVALDGAGARGKGKSGRYGSMEDVDGDGDLDLVVQVVNEINWAENTTEATLTGMTWDDIPIEGTDSVNIVPPEQ